MHMRRIIPEETRDQEFVLTVLIGLVLILVILIYLAVRSPSDDLGVGSLVRSSPAAPARAGGNERHPIPVVSRG